jgi:alpha-ketoglutarate-dependent taurine dioxygenase
MHTLPSVGGDTLVSALDQPLVSSLSAFKWASGYEAYDRLSPAFKKLLEGLTAVHDGNGFVRVYHPRFARMSDLLTDHPVR